MERQKSGNGTCFHGCKGIVFLKDDENKFVNTIQLQMKATFSFASDTCTQLINYVKKEGLRAFDCKDVSF